MRTSLGIHSSLRIMSSVPNTVTFRSLRGRTFGARYGDQNGVFVHTDQPPTLEDWNMVLQVWREIPDPRNFRVLVDSRGAAPNAVQRAELSKVLNGAKPRIALLTPSLLSRLAGKAFSLFIPDFRIFEVNQVDVALNHLELFGSERTRIERALAELRAEVLGRAVVP
jgi:hypothetical protein